MICDQCKKQMSARDTVRELLDQYREQLYIQLMAPKGDQMRIDLEGTADRIAEYMLHFVEKLSPRKSTDCDMVGHY